MNNDDITTKPTIETVLERINELGNQLTGQLTELRNGQAELRAGQMELKSDVATIKGDLADLNVEQRKLVHKITTLNDNILAVQADSRADQRAVDRRLEKLESQPS